MEFDSMRKKESLRFITKLSPQSRLGENTRPAYEDSSRELHTGLVILGEVCSSDILFNSGRKGRFLPVQRKRIMKPHMVVGSQVKSRQFF